MEPVLHPQCHLQVFWNTFQIREDQKAGCCLSPSLRRRRQPLDLVLRLLRRLLRHLRLLRCWPDSPRIPQCPLLHLLSRRSWTRLFWCQRVSRNCPFLHLFEIGNVMKLSNVSNEINGWQWIVGLIFLKRKKNAIAIWLMWLLWLKMTLFSNNIRKIKLSPFK